jgi:hypothetical protein
MKRWITIVARAAACCSLFAPFTAHAGSTFQLVDYSISPMAVRLVGSRAGVADAAQGQFTVVARMLGGPVPNASIVVELVGDPWARLCAHQADPDVSVDPGCLVARKRADATGSATFTLIGGSTAISDPDRILVEPALRIFVNGVLIRIARVGILDLDGVGGLGASDLSQWLGDFGLMGELSRAGQGRGDLDGDGFMTASDLSLWLTAYGDGGSGDSCERTCP